MKAVFLRMFPLRKRFCQALVDADLGMEHDDLSSLDSINQPPLLPKAADVHNEEFKMQVFVRFRGGQEKDMSKKNTASVVLPLHQKASEIFNSLQSTVRQCWNLFPRFTNVA